MFIVIGADGVPGRPVRQLLASGSAGITAAAGTIFFSFIGLDAVSTAGEEVRDPQRALPRAIIGALVIVVDGLRAWSPSPGSAPSRSRSSRARTSRTPAWP